MKNGSFHSRLTHRLSAGWISGLIAAGPFMSAIAAEPAGTSVIGEEAQNAAIAYEIDLGKTIRSHLHYVTTASVSTNPDAILLVKLSPAGEVQEIKMVRSSGIFGFDSAIKDAIRQSSPFPARQDGIMPGTFKIHFWLK